MNVELEPTEQQVEVGTIAPGDTFIARGDKDVFFSAYMVTRKSGSRVKEYSFRSVTVLNLGTGTLSDFDATLLVTPKDLKVVPA